MDLAEMKLRKAIFQHLTKMHFLFKSKLVSKTYIQYTKIFIKNQDLSNFHYFVKCCFKVKLALIMLSDSDIFCIPDRFKNTNFETSFSTTKYPL